MSARDSMIDRYFHGTLSHSERQELQHLLQTDPETQQLFETEKLLTRAMQAERSHLAAVDHSATYARFLTGLASQPATTTPAPFITPGTPWYGTMFGRASVITAVVAIFVLGAFALREHGVESMQQPTLQQASPQPQTSSATNTQAFGGVGSSTPQRIAPQASSQPAATDIAQPLSQASSSGNQPSNIDPLSTGSSSGSRKIGAAAAGSRLKEGALGRTDRQSHAANQSGTHDEAWTLPAVDQPPVFRSDSVNVNLKGSQP